MSFHESRCEGCPIQGRYTPMEQVGPPQAMFLVVTDRPSRAAASEGRLMTTAQLSTFANEAKRLGFTRDDFRFTPACHCPYDQDNHTTKERREIHKACRQHLLAEVESGSAHVVLPLGADATSQVYGKSTKITRVRGLASRVDGIGPPVFPLLSPGLVVKYPQNAPLFRADMDSFGRFVDADYRADHASAMDDDSVEYEFIDDLQFLIDAKPEVLCFDTETTGLRWYKNGQDVRTYKPAIHKGSAVFSPRFQILTMQFCIEEGKSYMLVWDHPERPVSLGDKPRLRNQLRQLLCRPETLVVGQNTKFDNVALWATEGIRFRIGGDTQMLTTLLDENQMEKNLDVQTKIHVEEMAGYADRFNVSVDKSRMWETRLAELMPYGCGDTDAGFRLYGKLEAEVAEDEKLWAHYARVSLPGLNAFAAVEMRGMYVDDQVALPEFKALMAREVEEQRVDLLGQVPREVRRDVIAEFCSKAGNKGPDGPVRALAFSRGAFLKEVLFTHPKGFRLRPQVFTKSTAKLRDESLREPSTSAKDHLPYFFDSCPFTQQLAEFVKDHSLLTKSVISFEKKYIVGRKVRPTYSLHRAVTGRTSCVHGDTPVVTRRGVVPAAEVQVGDYVFTHLCRWRKVLRLFRKDPVQMYGLHLSNGEVLTVTAHHQVMLHSGRWADVGYVLEGLGYAVSEQIADAEFIVGIGSGERVPDKASDSRRGGRHVWGQPCHRERDDSRAYRGRSIQYPEGYEVPAVKTGGEEPAVREPLGLRLRGWERVSNASGRGYSVLRSPHSDGGVPGDSTIRPTGHSQHPSHRREQAEQLDWKPSADYAGRPSSDTRQVPESGGGLTVEKVIGAGVHRVYDFEVEEDHSYLACGVFNHNSEDPNGQNFPKRGPRAKAYRTMFVAPPGHYVCENDLSQAELRIAAAMSGDRTMIDIYCSGGDIHKSTAAIVLGITVEAFARLPKEEQKEARQKAKACIAAGQLVLTRDRGLVSIENILLTDLVWDGVEWVHHEGVVYKGYREVITHEGLTATPDHRVYTEGRSNPVQFGALASSLSNERIAIGAIGTVGVRYSNPGPYRDGRKVAQIRNHALYTLQSISKDTHRQCTGREDDQLQVPKGDKELQHALLPQCGPGSSQDWREVRRYQAAHAEPELRLLQGLRCARDQVAVREQESLYSVCTGDYATDRLRGHGARPRGQQRPLRPWQSSLANESAELTEQTQLPTYSVQGQEYQCTGPTRQYRGGPPDVQVRGKLDVPTVCGEGVDGGADSGPRLAHVYDIVNAGPRHRFTVSGVVVSNCNFGFLYGMGWRKFIGYAKTQYNVVFTEQEAQRVRAGFFNRYKSLDAWHMSMREFARRHKYVRSFSGRIRHLPMIDSSEESVRGEAERQAINSPVQEFGSSLGVMAMGRLSEDIDPKYLEIVGFVHDALVYYTPKEYVEWAMKTVKRYMQSNPLQEWFNLRLPIPIVSDVGFGTNLGEIHECPGFSLEERFDFGTLRDKDGALLIEVPRQRIPPNNGLLQRSAYTLPEDLEDENAPIPVVRRSRLVRGVVSSAAILRVERSKKQMVINRRNIERRREQEREVRSTVVFAGRRRHAPVA